MFYFVTGSEGCGKSAIIPFLRDRLPHATVVDFDNAVRPYDFTEGWSNEVLEEVVRKHAGPSDVVVVGLTNPEQIAQRLRPEEYRVVVLSVSEQARRSRLRQRGAGRSVAADTEYLAYFQQLAAGGRVLAVIDTSSVGPESVAIQVVGALRARPEDRTSGSDAR